ncbi:DinB family protein [Limnovirga soli]|uniref:DinB family protein n=1 Tax=Limnovirga soli TaxID=2656915 RepID=A0A8J8FE54_9BACT|nr:DinB family protein [Limnovirga soli]NNV56411.1 DinB family protein [Limnovirga soli]
MQTSAAIALQMKEVYEGGNWSEVDLAATLADITWAEANIITPVSANSIAAILIHLQFYNNVVKDRLAGINTAIPDTNGFDVPKMKNAADWKLLQQNSFASALALMDVVSALPDEKLFEVLTSSGVTVYKTLHGVVEHAYYHLGQIVMLKKIIRTKLRIEERNNSL